MNKFSKLIGDIGNIGIEWHKNDIISISVKNRAYFTRSISDLPEIKNNNKAVVVSAGPSLHQRKSINILEKSDFKGVIITIDGAYVKCLKSGIIPDYVLTLDPHQKRVVRWFGDPNFEKNLEGDDYFERQDLDIAFRNNSIQENLNNISLVNQNGAGAKLIICSVAPINVVERTDSVGFDKYWWAPLVDNPDQPDSLTRELVEATKLPAMNTGGTVGTAAWVFALTTLKVPKIAVVGMDLGYYFADTSHLQTQSYYILKNLVGEKNMHEYYPEFVYPATGERFYTDPTYYWYRNNMLALLSSSGSTVYNCTGGGSLIGTGVECLEIEEFIKLNN